VWTHWLPQHAEEFEFHADPRRGVLLAILARSGGQVFESLAATEAAFDEPLDDALFRYTPKLGEQVRSGLPFVERLSLQAAINLMPFTVLVPTRLRDPEHTTTWFHYHQAQPRSPWEHLSLMFLGGEPHYLLHIEEAVSPDPELEQYEWECVERNGRPLRISDPGAGDQRLVAFEQHGTHVKITSDMDREALLDFASTLVPAAEGRKGEVDS
jgi:hypothetical protein